MCQMNQKKMVTGKKESKFILELSSTVVVLPLKQQVLPF